MNIKNVVIKNLGCDNLNKFKILDECILKVVEFIFDKYEDKIIKKMFFKRIKDKKCVVNAHMCEAFEDVFVEFKIDKLIMELKIYDIFKTEFCEEISISEVIKNKIKSSLQSENINYELFIKIYNYYCYLFKKIEYFFEIKTSVNEQILSDYNEEEINEILAEFKISINFEEKDVLKSLFNEKMFILKELEHLKSILSSIGGFYEYHNVIKMFINEKIKIFEGKLSVYLSNSKHDKCIAMIYIQVISKLEEKVSYLNT
ncbi:hypothetical protein A0H76_153 [Hepatospora eriocheir]|uniref:Uncharacterized protein n=1 Tax=Hepatospora eriocheir TaxID=1081669 RepID=A0A1X0QEN0_9MICR|nr:hypothetical protein A0H76_153 [Hepatospora eriocheir]